MGAAAVRVEEREVLSVCWVMACRGCGCCPCGGERGVERVLGGGLQGVRLLSVWRRERC